MKVILLTHSREVSKKTNTGQLIQHAIPNTKTIIWQRTQPDESLLQLIAAGKTALVFPAEESAQCVTINAYENFILIDSTWQEARKIYNRSPYLHELPRVQLTLANASSYHLRRNQVEGGMCTAECGVALLKASGEVELAATLNEAFVQFIK